MSSGMSVLDWSAISVGVAVLGSHMNKVLRCTDPDSIKCKNAKSWTGRVTRIHMFLVALTLILIPVALASSEVETSFLVIAGLVTAVSAAFYSLVVGCYGVRKRATSAVCRAKADELLGIACCVLLVALVVRRLMPRTEDFSSDLSDF